LIGTLGEVTYYPPRLNGHTTVFGMSRDWRMTSDWCRRYTEYIPPLAAYGPVAYTLPSDMDLDDWTQVSGYNNKWRETYVSGNPVARYLEYYDGRVFPYGTAIVDRTGALLSDDDALPPRWALHMVRWAPPDGQGNPVTFIINMRARQVVSGTWTAGACNVVFPLRYVEEYQDPFIHFIAPDPGTAYDVFSQGEIVSNGNAGASNVQGATRESWVFEYEEVWQDANGRIWGEAQDGMTEDDNFLRCHLLVRRVPDFGQWWYWSSEQHRLVEGPWAVTASGAVVDFALCQLGYGAGVSAIWPLYAKTLPVVSGSTWESDVDWVIGSWMVSGWERDCTTHPGGLKPYLTHTPDSYPQAKRPIIFLAQEWHDATIGNALSPASAYAQSTDGIGQLVEMRVALNDRWKGATSSFVLEPSENLATAQPTWLENGVVVIELGWQAGAGASFAKQQVATHYIVPDGIVIDGDGGSQLARAFMRVNAADWWAARGPQKEIMDFAQAGGWDVEGWAGHVANRVGIPTGSVSVAASVADKIIPWAALPSLESLAPRDGDGWQAHILAVEQAANIRVCFDRLGNGGMYVDDGPPEYDPGTMTPDFVIDCTDMTPGDEIVYFIGHSPTCEAFRNVVKCVVGPDGATTTEYWAQPTDDRRDGIGDEWTMAIRDAEAWDTDDLATAFLRDHYTAKSALRYKAALRPGVRPDQFCRVDNGTEYKIPHGSIWRVAHVEQLGRFNDADGELDAALVLAYLP
jgi:hypothetical protein